MTAEKIGGVLKFNRGCIKELLDSHSVIVNQAASHPVHRKQLGDLYKMKDVCKQTGAGHGWYAGKSGLVAARSVSPGGGQGPIGQVTSLADPATPD